MKLRLRVMEIDGVLYAATYTRGDFATLRVSVRFESDGHEEVWRRMSWAEFEALPLRTFSDEPPTEGPFAGPLVPPSNS